MGSVSFRTKWLAAHTWELMRMPRAVENAGAQVHRTLVQHVSL